MDLTSEQIFSFLADYGYYIMLPLMIIEGPVISIIGGMLAKGGTFHWQVVLVLSILGDVVGDVIFYSLGYFLGDSFVQKVGKYVGINDKLIVKVKGFFKNHGGKTIFLVKATTGLCWATFATAGIVKMKFSKFLLFSILGGIVWSSLLVSLGYFYGYMWQEFDKYLGWARIIVPVIASASFLGLQLFRKYQTQKNF